MFKKSHLNSKTKILGWQRTFPVLWRSVATYVRFPPHIDSHISTHTFSSFLRFCQRSNKFILCFWAICSLWTFRIIDCIVESLSFYYFHTEGGWLGWKTDANTGCRIYCVTLSYLVFPPCHFAASSGGNFKKNHPWNWSLILESKSVCVSVRVWGWGGGYLCPAGGVLYFCAWFIPLSLQLAVKLHGWKLLTLQNFWGNTDNVYLLENLWVPCSCAVVPLLSCRLSFLGSHASTCHFPLYLFFLHLDAVI